MVMSRQMVWALTVLRANQALRLYPQRERSQQCSGSGWQPVHVFENETHKSCDLLRHNSSFFFFSSHLTSIDMFCTGESRFAYVLWKRLRCDKEEKDGSATLAHLEGQTSRCWRPPNI